MLGSLFRKSKKPPPLVSFGTALGASTFFVAMAGAGSGSFFATAGAGLGAVGFFAAFTSTSSLSTTSTLLKSKSTAG